MLIRRTCTKWQRVSRRARADIQRGIFCGTSCPAPAFVWSSSQSAFMSDTPFDAHTTSSWSISMSLFPFYKWENGGVVRVTNYPGLPKRAKFPACGTFSAKTWEVPSKLRPVGHPRFGYRTCHVTWSETSEGRSPGLRVFPPPESGEVKRMFYMCFCFLFFKPIPS